MPLEIPLCALTLYFYLGGTVECNSCRAKGGQISERSHRF